MNIEIIAGVRVFGRTKHCPPHPHHLAMACVRPHSSENVSYVKPCIIISAGGCNRLLASHNNAFFAG